MTTELRVSVENVAKHYGLAKLFVYRWLASPRLPAHKLARGWKFTLAVGDDGVRAKDAAEDRMRGKR